MEKLKKFDFQEFADNLFEKLSPLIELFNKPFPRALQSGFLSLTTIITASAFILLINMMSTPNGFAEGLTILPFLTPYQPIMATVYYCTYSIISIFAVHFIAEAYAKELGTESRLTSVIAMVVFLVVSVPGLDDFGNLTTWYLGTSNLFTAIVVAWITVRVVKFCLDHNINIRMPDSVPPAIAQSFEIIIPFCILLVFFMAVKATGFDINTAITTVISPILKAGDSAISITINYAVKMFLWFFGIHGDSLVSPIYTPMITQWTIENMEAWQAGTALPHIWTDYTQRLCTGVDQIIVILVLCKSSQLRTVAKLAAPCCMCNVYEPLLFGVPLVMNPIVYIPYYIAGNIVNTLGYLFIQWGIIGRPRMSVPWVTPGIIGTFIATGSFWGVLLLFACNLLVNFVICGPFYVIYDRQLLAKEAEQKANAEAK